MSAPPQEPLPAIDVLPAALCATFLGKLHTVFAAWTPRAIIAFYHSLATLRDGRLRIHGTRPVPAILHA